MTEPPYIPDRNDINRAKKEIQDGWTEQERKRRAGIVVKPYTVPEASLPDWCEAIDERIREERTEY